MSTTFDDTTRVAELSGGQTLFAIHRSAQCYGEACPVHNPSDHPLREFDLFWNDEGRFFYRNVYGTNMVDPDDYGLSKNGSVIVRNSAMCTHCGVELVSTHRHDFVQCACGGAFVDGGHDYLRRGGDRLKDTSVVAKVEDYKCSMGVSSTGRTPSS